MNPKYHLLLALLGGLLAAATATAQLVITSSSQSTTIDFQSDVGWDGASPTPADPTTGDNVFKFKTGSGTFRSILERETNGWTASWSDDYGMSADAWSWGTDNLDLGMGVGARTLFDDYNNNATLVDLLGTINAVAFADRGTLGIGAAGDKLYRVSQATTGDGPFRDYTLTLRVQNVSGATISDWNASVDTWYNDVDADVTTVTLQYSTDNVTFTPIDSYTPVATGGSYVAQSAGGGIQHRHCQQ